MNDDYSFLFYLALILIFLIRLLIIKLIEKIKKHPFRFLIFLSIIGLVILYYANPIAFSGLPQDIYNFIKENTEFIFYLLIILLLLILIKLISKKKKSTQYKINKSGEIIRDDLLH